MISGVLSIFALVLGLVWNQLVEAGCFAKRKRKEINTPSKFHLEDSKDSVLMKTYYET